LHSATGAVRKVFPVGNRGILNLGTLASMLLLDGNPAVDINATKKIDTIWKNGVHFKRHLPDKPDYKSTVVTRGSISDFNQSLFTTEFGQGINETSDHIVGGKSEVALSRGVRSIENNLTDHYLHIKGVIKPGFSFPWSGFAFIPGNSYNQGVNLSQLKTLVFDAKAGEGSKELSIMLFNVGSFQPSTLKVILTESWQSFNIDLAKFEHIDINNVSNISFVSTMHESSFEFMIDNLKLE